MSTTTTTEVESSRSLVKDEDSNSLHNEEFVLKENCGSSNFLTLKRMVLMLPLFIMWLNALGFLHVASNITKIVSFACSLDVPFIDIAVCQNMHEMSAIPTASGDIPFQPFVHQQQPHNEISVLPEYSQLPFQNPSQTTHQQHFVAPKTHVVVIPFHFQRNSSSKNKITIDTRDSVIFYNADNKAHQLRSLTSSKVLRPHESVMFPSARGGSPFLYRLDNKEWFWVETK